MSTGLEGATPTATSAATLPMSHGISWSRTCDEPFDVAHPIVAAGARANQTSTMDEDLEAMGREQLVSEIKRLRAGIREHRDDTGQRLCWYHPKLWGLLPERTDPVPAVPAWPEFIAGCVRYRQSLDEQLPHAPRTNEPYRG